MTDFQGPRCETCRFFWHEDAVCRRYPPQLVALAVKPAAKEGDQIQYLTGQRFPSMLPSGWCGEWSGA